MKYCVECSNINKKFKKNIALDDVSFNIEENSITGLVGRNGSGKTTLMKILSCLLHQNSGDIKIFGNNPTNNIYVLKDIIYSTFETYKSGEDTLISLIKTHELMYENFDSDFALNLLKYFDISIKSTYHSMSTGNKSIFNFCLTIATRCKLTLLDEPTLGMDAVARKSIYDILIRDFHEHPRTIIISSHILNEYENLLSDIILIDEGKILFNKSIENVYEYAHRLDGDITTIKKYINHDNTIKFSKGDINSYAIVKGKLTQDIKKIYEHNGLSASILRPEEICAYLTSEKKEDELECLWTKKN